MALLTGTEKMAFEPDLKQKELFFFLIGEEKSTGDKECAQTREWADTAELSEGRALPMAILAPTRTPTRTHKPQCLAQGLYQQVFS